MDATTLDTVPPRPGGEARTRPRRIADASGCQTGWPELDVRAVVMLGGMLRPTPLRAGIRRSPLDLPIEAGSRLSDIWRAEFDSVGRLIGSPRVPVRLLLDGASPAPQPIDFRGNSAGWVVARDIHAWRGTGGAVRDVAIGYHDDDRILVINAFQLPVGSLWRIAATLTRTAADVALVSHVDGTPAGIMLARCGCLKQLPAEGYLDLKEQAIPRISASCHVRVVERYRPTGIPIRTASDYIRALRCHFASKLATTATERQFIEDWRPLFAIVEAGAHVHPSAEVHDSVVLAGGCVEEGAVVVRSVVCPGGVVLKRQHVIAQLITGRGA